MFVQDLSRVVPDLKHSLLANSLWVSFTNRECKPGNTCVKSSGTPALSLIASTGEFDSNF